MLNLLTDLHLEVSLYTEIRWASPVWRICDDDWFAKWWDNYGENGKSIAQWNSYCICAGLGPFHMMKPGLFIKFHEAHDLILFKLSL